MASQAAQPLRKKRLHIIKFVLENFKSYAGVVEIGPLHKSLTAVVGPNGSGKSNVFDALLFVFGKRASRIRSKKLSELVHCSELYPNLQECKVSAYFQEIVDTDDEDGFEPVPNSSFVLTRTVNKSDESTYYFNGKRSSFTEVTDILRAEGIDLENNRFLILQGEVEQIAMMKPKANSPHEQGCQEFLEEVIGTDKYIKPINECSEKIEQLNEERQQRLNRAKITEKERDALEGPKNEALDFIHKQMELNSMQGVLFQKFELDHTVQSEKANEKRAALQEQQEEHRKKLAEAVERLNELETTYKKLGKEHDALRGECERTKAEFDNYERKDVKHKEDVKHEKAKIKKLEANISKLVKKIDELEKAMEDGKKQLPQLEKKVGVITARKEEEEQKLDAIFESVKGKTEHLRVQMEAKQKELIPLRNAVNEAQQKVDVIATELRLVDERRESAVQKVEDAKAFLAESTKQLAVKEQELKEGDQTVAVSKKRLPQAKAELESVSAREEAVTQSRQELRVRIEEGKSQLAAAKSSDAALDSIMKLKKKALPGVYGRLGDLATIDEKYDVAVSTAAPSLRNVLVDNAETGKKCVSHLREHNVGRMTFVILDQLSENAKNFPKNIETPENAPRLFDLIAAKDPVLLPAFYYALQDTLVADSLEQATRLAYNSQKRWRVVTLKGELIDSSGTMSGGGNTVSRGLMRTTSGSKAGSSAMSKQWAEDAPEVDAKELDKMSAKLVQCEQELQTLRQKKKSLESEISHLTEAIAQHDVTMQKVQMDVDTLRNQIADTKARLPTLQAACTLSAEETKKRGQLAQEKEKQQKALDQARENASKLEGEVEKLEKAILEAGGAKLRTQKAVVQGLSEELDQISKSITKIQVDAESGVKNVTKSKKEAEKAEKEKKQSEERLEALQQEYTEMENRAEQVMRQFQAADAQLKEKSAALEGVQTELAAMKTEMEKVKGADVDLSSQMEALTKAVKEGKARAKHWASKVKEEQKKYEEMAQLAGGARCDDDEEEEEKEAEQKQAQPAQPEAEVKTAEAAPAAESDENKESAEAGKEAAALPPAAPGKAVPFRVLSPEELEKLDRQKLEKDIAVLEAAISSMSPNMRAIADFKEKDAEYRERMEALDAITRERDTARKVYEELRKRRLEEFMAGFSVINMKFKEMYQMLTLGGDAELDLVDNLDPFSEGIEISVRPPKKSWKKIQNLSGGEKTLSSLSLIFALHHYKPTPLYVMDEIDAALDFKNVSIVANYIKERTKNAQFIVISLRNNMFELADRLVGIYKTHDCTRSITIDPRKFVLPTVSVPAISAPAPAPAAAAEVEAAPKESSLSGAIPLPKAAGKASNTAKRSSAALSVRDMNVDDS